MVRSITIRKNSEETPTLSGTSVSIATDAGCFCIPEADGVLTISTDITSSYSDWYDDFIARKTTAMMYGGSYTYVYMDSELTLFDFSVGYNGLYGTESDNQVVTQIQGMSPDSKGRFFIHGGKYLDVYKFDYNKIAIKKTQGFYEINKYYEVLHRMTGQLYNALNRLSLRLRRFDPGNRDYPELGPLLGTIANYQAVVARWNHYAWQSTMAFTTSETSGGAVFSLGYVNLACMLHSVWIHCTIERVGLVDASGNDVNSDDWPEVSAYPANLTLYKLSDDGNITKNGPDISLSMYRNGAICDGSGYLTQSSTLNTLDISLRISGSPAFLAEQYYHMAFAISVPTGLLETYTPIDPGKAKLYHKFVATTSWIVDLGDPYVKTSIIRVAAPYVTVVGGNTGEEEEKQQ